MNRADVAWAGLNSRQQIYLRAILEEDQAAEADIKARRAAWERVPPAAEWRLITFSIAAPATLIGYSTVVRRLREQGRHDPGAGSLLAALERRGLIEPEHDRVEIPPYGWFPRVRVRLTRTGRAIARAGTGIAAPKKTPKGLLGRWSLLGLARFYAAGPEGLDSTSVERDRSKRAPGDGILLQLERRGARDGEPGSFWESTPPIVKDGITHRRLRITDAGRRHYELHAACYRELYGPEVEGFTLPDPEPRDGAHAGLAEHTTRKPRHLLREADLRVLAVLLTDRRGGYGRGRQFLRESTRDPYEEYDLEMPAEVSQIPDGLLPRQIRDIARSEKPADRLAAYPGGPLARTIDVTIHEHWRDEPFIRQLLVVTDAGREHYRTHHAEYQATYPELELPAPGPTSATEQPHPKR